MSQRAVDGAGYLRYIWLVYLGALVFQPLFDPSAGLPDWLAVIVLIGVFLPIYLAICREPTDRERLVLLALLAALAVVGSLVNSGASVFVIYAAAAAGHLTPVRRAVRVIAALEGVVAAMFLISPVPMPWRLAALGPAFIFTLVIGAATIFEAERERAHRRLLRADEEIERLATLAERERIARDLHDLLGHTLSVVVLKSQLAARLVAADPDRAVDEMNDIERIGRDALGEVRTAVAGYRAKGLDVEVAGARRALAAAEVTADVHTDVPALPAAQSSALALAVRESVTNVVRHAGAEHATIRVSLDGGDVVLEVSDDGRGTAAPEGAGLTGMRERIAALGGGVTRESGESGTRVRVRLPLPGDGEGERARRVQTAGER